MSISKLSKGQLQALHSLFHLYEPRFLDAAVGDAGSTDARSARLAWASGIVGRAVSSFNDLLPHEAGQLIEKMKLSLGQKIKAKRPRRPGRDLALRYGRAGRNADTSNEIQMVDAPTLELLERLRDQVGWTQERLDSFLKSKHSPVRGGAIRTLGDANRVIWVMRSIFRRGKHSASKTGSGGNDAATLKRAG